MKSTDVHLVNVCDDVSCSQFIRNSGNEFLRGLLREGGYEDAFWLNVALFDEVYRPLDERIGFPVPGPAVIRTGPSAAEIAALCPSSALPKSNIYVLQPFLRVLYYDLLRDSLHDVRYITLQRRADFQKDSRADVLTISQFSHSRGADLCGLSQIGFIHVLVYQKLPKFFYSL